MAAEDGIRIVLPEFARTQAQAINHLLTLEGAQFPETARLKSTDIVVRVRAAPIAFVDFIMMTGQYQHMASPPYVPGLEFAGDVAWTGDDVARFSIGDRVMSDFMTVGPRSKGDYRDSGAWASYAVAPESGLRALPESFDYSEGCSFAANCETAYFALVKRARLQPRERVLITGASGAAGMATVQMAKILGAEVFACGRSVNKLRAVAAAGADHVIQLPSADRDELSELLRDETRRRTDGRGVDVVIDTVGDAIGYAAFRSLGFEGRFVIVGWASNVSDTRGRETFIPDRLPTNIMQMKCLEVLGSPMVIYSMANPDWRARQLGQISSWASEGLLRPHISHRFAARDFRKAATVKFNGEVTGSCVLTF